ncbi:YibE/F family protein [Acidimicrobiia bacterium EGI L10123]|uniref:YibE/F family protein n=1 Tax=Salinilacustrithrix flava TaxID=2957203 RepID=UPI003D7C20BD|nr:YibE/F family protein [Acidimicrobiia bacterium EGI L10123]
MHDHSHDLGTAPEVARALRLAVLAIVVLTAIGLFVWRPDGGVAIPSAVQGQGQRVEATVTGTAEIECAGTDFGGAPIVCEEILLDITSGANAGRTGSFELYPQPGSPSFDAGDRIVVNEYEVPDGGIAYTFADYQRSRPMLLLLGIFVVAVIAMGRFQGLRALAGLVVSGIVLLAYAFPALLDGKPPLGIALVSSVIIAVAALYLSHGINDTTTVALLGTLAALGLTGLLAAVFTSAAQITGLASEDQIFLMVSAEGVDVRGLVLAGIVLGSLGVLDDVTVTQVSAVARLREANPGYGIAELYRSGVRIGRDHIASVVNTLVLAYAGAALPLLLFYSNIGIGLSESVTSEIVAVEIIRTLVGSIGLVAAVPLTTGLAAVVVTGTGFRRGGPDAAAAPAPAPAPAPAASPEPAGDWDEFAPRTEEF